VSVAKMCAMLDTVYADKSRLTRDELVEHARRAGLSDERVRTFGRLPDGEIEKDDALKVLLAHEESGMEDDQALRWQAGK
jgi:hypothetical protein